MGYNAIMPTYPNPEPRTTFKNQPLTYEIAEDIFIGHLNTKSSIKRNNDDIKSWSWKVVCGQNPAYDYFSCQHQLFYRNNETNHVWYDPVFKVTTLDGDEVWRRRHYRVKRSKVPGSFFFSVIDNGVASNEYWRILDCSEDLSWAVFYYSGAAKTAGTSYTGALVVSKDGNWPTMTSKTTKRINDALLKGGIQNWELFEVSNNNCNESCAAGMPPLEINDMIILYS